MVQECLITLTTLSTKGQETNIKDHQCPILMNITLCDIPWKLRWTDPNEKSFDSWKASRQCSQDALMK